MRDTMFLCRLFNKNLYLCKAFPISKALMGKRWEAHIHKRRNCTLWF